MGLIQEEYRLPLTRISNANRERLRLELVRLKLIETL
jgi:hypothetical protein